MEKYALFKVSCIAFSNFSYSQITNRLFGNYIYTYRHYLKLFCIVQQVGQDEYRVCLSLITDIQKEESCNKCKNVRNSVKLDSWLSVYNKGWPSDTRLQSFSFQHKRCLWWCIAKIFKYLDIQDKKYSLKVGIKSIADGQQLIFCTSEQVAQHLWVSSNHIWHPQFDICIKLHYRFSIVKEALIHLINLDCGVHLWLIKISFIMGCHLWLGLSPSVECTIRLNL